MWQSNVAVFVLAATCGMNVWAINKCQTPEGKFVFQDAPCAGKGEKVEVKPASGNAVAPLRTPRASDDGDAPMSEVDRLNASVAESQKERRRQELERRAVPTARNAVLAHRAQCAQIQRDLEAEKKRWHQNLWGKTNSAQMASEQAAAATRCDTKDRELVNTHNLRLKACQDLGGCSASLPL